MHEPSSEDDDDDCRDSCRAQGCVRGTQSLHSHTIAVTLCAGVSLRGMLRVWYKRALMCGGCQEGRECPEWGGMGKLPRANQQKRL